MTEPNEEYLPACIARAQLARPERLELDGAAAIADFLPDWARMYLLVPSRYLVSTLLERVGADTEETARHLTGRHAVLLRHLGATGPVRPHPSGQPDAFTAFSGALGVDVTVHDDGRVEVPEPSPAPPVLALASRLPEEMGNRALGVTGGFDSWHRLRSAAVGARGLLLRRMGAEPVPVRLLPALVEAMLGALEDMEISREQMDATRAGIDAARLGRATPLAFQPVRDRALDAWLDRYVKRHGAEEPLRALCESGQITETQAAIIGVPRALSLALTGAAVPTRWPAGAHAVTCTSMVPVTLPDGRGSILPRFLTSGGWFLLPPDQSAPPRPGAPVRTPRSAQTSGEAPGDGPPPTSPPAKPRRVGTIGFLDEHYAPLRSACDEVDLDDWEVLRAVLGRATAAAVKGRELAAPGKADLATKGADPTFLVGGLRIGVGLVDDDELRIEITKRERQLFGAPCVGVRIDAAWNEPANAWVPTEIAAFGPGRRKRSAPTPRAGRWSWFRLRRSR